MAELDKDATVSLKELMVSTLRNGGRCNKVPDREGRNYGAEFKQKLLEERAIYQKLLNPTVQ